MSMLLLARALELAQAILSQDGMIFLHRVGCDCMTLESYDCTCGAQDEIAALFASALMAACVEADRSCPRASRGRAFAAAERELLRGMP